MPNMSKTAFFFLLSLFVSLSQSSLLNQLDNFCRLLDGEVVFRWNANFSSAVSNQVGIYDDSEPFAVIYAESETDVQRLIKFFGFLNLNFRVRSGGSSFGGYSTCTGNCVILDVSRLNQFQATQNEDNSFSVTVGPGVSVTDLRANVVGQNQYLLPYGICALVNIGGYATGGGNGYFMRTLGLLTDFITEVRIVTANGRVRVLNENNNEDEDLLIAVRGGSGGNFGVITQYTFSTVNQPLITTGVLVFLYTPETFTEFFITYRTWLLNNANSIPNEFNNFITCGFIIEAQSFGIVVQGIYVSNDLQAGAGYVTAFFNALISGVTLPPINNQVIPANLQTFDQIIYGPDGDVFDLLNSWVQPSRFIFDYNQLNDFFIGAANQFFEQVVANTVPGEVTLSVFLTVELQGGQILDNDPLAESTSYPNRNALMNVLFGISTVKPNDPLLFRPQLEALGATCNDILNILGSNQVYINYQNQYQTDIQLNYFGSNLGNQNDQIFERLQQVKQTYDPHNIFNYPLSIPLP